MGHLTATPAAEAAYRGLQQRLDRMPTGAPDTAALRRILRLLFTEAEAELAAQIPTLIPVAALAQRLSRDEGELAGTLDDMARRGLVLDIEHGGQRWVALAPVVIGFFEFTFMRVRDDAPMETLAELFDEYLFTDPEHTFAHAVFQGSVQIGRSLVREEALPDHPPTEVLDWERATTIVTAAETVGVALCPCRHHAQLLGTACDAPLRTCLSFGGAAESLIRADLAERVSTEEALAILDDAKRAGLAQTADNVQHDISYMCNCCGCCCGMMQAIRSAGIHDAIVSSNWVAETDHDVCRGCRSGCVDACPADAIARVDSIGEGVRKYWAVVDPERCLGCGVCVEACRFGARTMAPRERRVFTPVDTFDRMVAMAVERGKLGDLLIDTLAGAGPHAIARMLQILERTRAATALRAVAPLRSAYLRGFLAVVHAGSRRAMATGAASRLSTSLGTDR
jgi:NAD-dependent dihydropyrimidine dehydrogenase PreA subunit